MSEDARMVDRRGDRGRDRDRGPSGTALLSDALTGADEHEVRAQLDELEACDCAGSVLHDAANLIVTATDMAAAAGLPLPPNTAGLVATLNVNALAWHRGHVITPEREAPA